MSENTAAPPTKSPRTDTDSTDTPLRLAQRGQRPPTTPVWFLGQSRLEKPVNWDSFTFAEKISYALDPEIMVRDVSRPVREWGVDAALCSTDVLMPLRLAGMDLRGRHWDDGTEIRPLATAEDVKKLVARPLPDWEALVVAVRETRRVLGDETVLIALAATPFVLSSLLVEGMQPSEQHLRTRVFLQSQPRAWKQLMDWAALLVEGFLCAQVRGGCEAIHLVDPWIGVLSQGEICAMAEPYAQAIFEKFPEVVKYSCRSGAKQMLGQMPYADVIGVGSGVTLCQARELAVGKPLYGNLDTAYLSTNREMLARVASEVLRAGREAPAHIFGCGDGLPPEVESDTLKWLVDFVHNFRDF